MIDLHLVPVKMLTEMVSVGKKNAIYLPKRVVKALGIEAGEKMQITLEGRSIRMEVIGDPLKLALEGEKFAKVNPEEIEAISLEEQTSHVRGSS